MNQIKAMLAKWLLKTAVREAVGAQTGIKKWYQSTAVWAGVTTFIIGGYEALKPVAAQHGINLPDIPVWVFSILGSIGIYGRVTATKVIK